MRIFTYIIFLLILKSTNVLAKDICFEFDMISADPAVTAGIVQGAEFLRVNGLGVKFSTISQTLKGNVPIYTQNRGCMNNAYLFDRPNVLDFGIETVDKKPIPAQKTIYLFVVHPNGRKLLASKIWEKGSIGAGFKINGSFSLKELDPEKAEQIEREKKDEEHKQKINLQFKKDIEELKKYRDKQLEERKQKSEKNKNEKNKDSNSIDEKFKGLGDSRNEMASSLDQDIDLLDSMEVNSGSSKESFCFPMGTMLKTANSTLAIENIRKGDLVVANGFADSVCAIAPVEEVFEREVFSLIEIKLESSRILSTLNHPFFVWELGIFQRADNLVLGQHLLSVTGETLRVSEVNVIELETPAKAYNIKVRGYHNYFVGDQFLLVHNCDGVLQGAKDGISQTIEDITQAIFHPIDTVVTIGEAAYDIKRIAAESAKLLAKVLDEFPEYSVYEKGELIGKLSVELGSILVPGASAAAGSHLAKIMASTKMSSRAVTAIKGGFVEAVRLNNLVIECAKKLGVASKETLGKLNEWLKTPLITGEAGTIRWKHDLFVDLASPERRTHILHGDTYGGGHMWPGKPGKSVFPKEWSGDKIMHMAADIATDPQLNWKQKYTQPGRPLKYEVTGIRDGVEIRVVFTPGNNVLLTAHPVSGPGVIRNP